MKKYIIEHEINYKASDLINFFKNEFSAPLSAMDKYLLESKSFGFRDYSVIIDNDIMKIYENKHNENGAFNRDIKFTINIKNFATWGDFEKYLRRQNKNFWKTLKKTIDNMTNICYNII